MFFIAAWFLSTFSTFPSRYQAIFIPLVTEENIPIIVVATLAISVSIVFKFIQCEKVFINLVFGWVFLWGAYQIVLFAWAAVLYWEQIQIHPLKFIGLFINMACAIYLALPSTRKKISIARAHIETEKMRKFQLKQMKKR